MRELVKQLIQKRLGMTPPTPETKTIPPKFMKQFQISDLLSVIKVHKALKGTDYTITDLIEHLENTSLLQGNRVVDVDTVIIPPKESTAVQRRRARRHNSRLAGLRR